MKKLLSFDIEIADVFDLAPGEDLAAHGPFSISVASTVVAGGEERLWYSETGEGRPARCLTRSRAGELLEYLETMQMRDYHVCAWNGLGFDLRWIGHAARDMVRAARVALRSYDPMFQFFNQRGFPVGLAAVGKGMGIAQTKLMSGADAPREWQAGNHEKVFEYVLGDSRITNEIVLAIDRHREVRWVTSKGKPARETMRELKPVARVLRDPLPDQSWMDRPLPRERFHAWFPPGVLPGRASPV